MGLNRRRILLAAAPLLAAAALAPGAAVAAIDLSGYYVPVNHEDAGERGPGPDAGDYLGLPINDAMRGRADTWNGSLLTLPERQCVPHPSTYGWRGVGNLRIWETRDPVSQQLVKLDTYIVWESQHREIWMDGRAHPPESAPHSWQGFSTGKWEGDVLVVHTTHLKPGWIRRNGLALSDKATLDERFFMHDGVLNHVMMVSDPVYLTEPMVKTNLFGPRPYLVMAPYPCRPAVEIPREKGVIPHNDFHDQSASAEFAKTYSLPLPAARGGAETALPEFMDSPAAKTASTAAQPIRSAAR